MLEASYIAFQLEPYHGNIRKRPVKAPKLYFYDVGLASHLIGIETANQVATHPLRGALFENAMVMEALKFRLNRGRTANLSLFRDQRGLECDLLYATGEGTLALEAKSGATYAADSFDALDRVAAAISEIRRRAVVYGGDEEQERTRGTVPPLAKLSSWLEEMDEGA